MFTIADHKALIDVLGGNLEVSRFGQWLPVTVGQWKQQNRIPVEYWPRIIELAAEKGVDGVNSTWLMKTWPPRKKRGAAMAEANAA